MSQTHFGIIIFFFCFLSFFLSVSKHERKGRKIPSFQYTVVRCFMHADHALGSAVVVKNWPTPP